MAQPNDPRHGQAAAAGEMLEVFLNDLCRITGVERYVVLAGAHANLVAMMVDAVGGPMTADALDRASERIRNEPSRTDLALAASAVKH